MLEKGLIGPASAEKRAALQRRLGLPEHLTANGLMEALDTLLTREELRCAVSFLRECGQTPCNFRQRRV